MQEQDTIFNKDQENNNTAQPLSELAQISQVPPQAVSITNGWFTSSGQMTMLFLLVATVASFFGFQDLTADKLNTVYGAIVTIVTIMGPLITAAWALVAHTNSRGKIQSNAIIAGAAVAASSNANVPQAVGLMGHGTFGKILGGVKQGLAIGSAVAPIIPGPAGRIIDISTGVANALDPDPQTARTLTDQQILDAFAKVNDNIMASNSQMSILMNALRAKGSI